MRQRRDGLTERIRQIRIDLYGEHGGPILAAALGLPYRTWADYESGVVVPGPVLLRFIEVTGVCPHWLLTSEPPRYLGPGRGPCLHPLAPSS